MLLQQIKLAGVGKALDLSIVQDKTYILTKKNQQGILFCVTNKPSWHLKLPFQPSSIKSGQTGIFICGFHYIKSPKGKNLIRPNLAFLGKDTKLRWHKDLCTQEKFNGHCLIWNLLPLPNDECIVMLLFETESDYVLEHVRFSSDGKMIWKQSIRSIKINPLYFYPHKIGPHLFRHGSTLYNVGAYILENSPSATSAIGLDIKNGQLKGTYKANITNALYTSAVQAPNGAIAVSWQPYGQKNGENGILLLNKKLKCIGEYRTKLCTWNDMRWNGKSLIIAGRAHHKQHYHPAVQQLGSNKYLKIYEEHSLASHIRLAGSLVTYLDKGTQIDTLRYHNLIIRDFQTSWIYQPNHKEFLSQPIMKKGSRYTCVVYSISEKDSILVKLDTSKAN